MGPSMRPAQNWIGAMSAASSSCTACRIAVSGISAEVPHDRGDEGGAAGAGAAAEEPARLHAPVPLHRRLAAGAERAPFGVGAALEEPDAPVRPGDVKLPAAAATPRTPNRDLRLDVGDVVPGG